MPPSWIEQLKNEVGPGRVVDDEAEIALHSYDWWPVAATWRRQGKQPYRPDVVVRPKGADDVSHLLSWAREWCAGDAARSGVERYRCAVADARWYLSRYVGNAQRDCARRDQPAGKGRSRYDRARAGREAQRAGLHAEPLSPISSPLECRRVGCHACHGPVFVSLGRDRGPDRGSHGRAPDR